MKIKKGDKVLVIAGKDKGKTGAVERALPRENRVYVSGVNVGKRHMRRTRGMKAGQVVEHPMPIHASNVSLLDPKDGTRTRVGYKTEGEKKVRIARKSGQTL